MCSAHPVAQNVFSTSCGAECVLWRAVTGWVAWLMGGLGRLFRTHSGAFVWPFTYVHTYNGRFLAVYFGRLHACCVCMYACCVCMYACCVCMYACCVCMHARCVCMYACCVCMYACMLCMHVCIHTYTRIHTHLYTHTYTLIRAQRHTSYHVYARTHRHMYIFVYIVYAQIHV
jgi:hypothetical protein